MSHPTHCLCCRDSMLRFAGKAGVFWRCPSCLLQVQDSLVSTIKAKQLAVKAKAVESLSESLVSLKPVLKGKAEDEAVTSAVAA
jgi:hypothetical protein